MAEFSKLTVTSKGKSLIAKSLAGESEIKFPKVATSSAVYDEGELEGLTQLDDIQQEEEPSNIVRTSDEVVKIETYFSNLALEIGYHINTIGVYADDPDEGEILYGVSVSTGGSCYMPAYNGVTTSGAVFQISTTVGNAENVSLEVNLAGVATIGQLKDVQDDLEDNINDLEQRIEDSLNPIANYGLYYQRMLSASDDLNDIKTTGIYYVATGDIPANSPYQNAFILIVVGAGSSTARIVQIAIRYGATGQLSLRPITSGTWLDWSAITTTNYQDLHVFCTQSEYDALPDTKLTDGVIYFISTGGVIRNGVWYVVPPKEAVIIECFDSEQYTLEGNTYNLNLTLDITEKSGYTSYCTDIRSYNGTNYGYANPYRVRKSNGYITFGARNLSSSTIYVIFRATIVFIKD